MAFFLESTFLGIFVFGRERVSDKLYMVSAVLSVALVMAGVSAYYIHRKTDDATFWRRTLKIAVVVLLVTAPLQAVQGDAYTQHVYETQPQKFAAMEAVYETQSHVDEVIIAFPMSIADITDPRAQDLFKIGISGGASWLAIGSTLAPLFLGIFAGNWLLGSPGSLTLGGIVVGVVLVALAVVDGAAFLAMKTRGDLQIDAVRYGIY